VEFDTRLCDPEVAEITEVAARAFESELGCKVEAFDPGFESPRSSCAILWTMSHALRLQRFLPEWGARMDPDLVRLVEGARRFGPAEYGEALASRAALWDRTRMFFDRYELLLTPTLPVPPFAAGLGAPGGILDDRGALPPFPEWLPFTYPWNLTGQPAATVPCGFTREGLPVGLQIGSALRGCHRASSCGGL
jgi:aspartyl-tRNA(Asn)/glutamyl-tRNA(Gln) amidotransferase subunit A